MPLIARSSSYDSVSEMDDARFDRYWDATACALDGRDFGACYLFGYVIEMSLKVAYFRFIETPSGGDLRPLLRDAANGPAFARRGNLHNVEQWVEQLLGVRERQGRQLDAAFAGALEFRAEQVAQNWSEWMRYRRSIPAGEEVEDLLEQADWFIDNHERLWR